MVGAVGEFGLEKNYNQTFEHVVRDSIKEVDKLSYVLGF